MVIAVDDAFAGLVDQLYQRRHVMGRPGLGHQLFPGRGWILGGADKGDHLIEINHRDRQPDQAMGPIPRLAEVEYGAPGDDLFPEGDEEHQDLTQVKHFRPPGIERQHIYPKRGLELGVAKQLVEDHLMHGVALKLDHHPDPLAVRFIAQVGDALHLLVAHHFGDLFHHPRLVHLVGNFGDDDGLAVAAQFLDLGAPTHEHGAAPGVKSRADTRGPVNDPPGREIRTGHAFHKPFHRGFRVVEQHATGVDQLAQVMGRDIGRHADGDTTGAVDQKVGKSRRKDRRLAGRIVVILLEIDGVLVDVLKKLVGRVGQAGFGISHGGGAIAVHGAEVALAIDERQAQGEFLRHAHHGIVDRRIAMGMIFTHDIAHHPGRFTERPVPVVAHLVHGMEDAPVHRLEPVAHIGKGARDDHAHGVIEVRALHLFFDGDR